MTPHVEDARDRLVAMNRPVPEPTEAAIAESDAEERSRQPLHFTDMTLDIIKHGPLMVQAVHVGEPTLDDPKRILAPDITKQNKTMFVEAVNQGKPPAPATAVQPTGPNEPPRSDQPSTAPLQMQAPGGGTGVGVEIVNAPNSAAASTGQRHTQPILTRWSSPWFRPTRGSARSGRARRSPCPGERHQARQNPTPAVAAPKGKQKKPKVDQSDESSSKKKKKKGLDKLNPF